MSDEFLVLEGKVEGDVTVLARLEERREISGESVLTLCCSDRRFGCYWKSEPKEERR